jgi:hypothetical protein
LNKNKKKEVNEINYKNEIEGLKSLLRNLNDEIRV